MLLMVHWQGVIKLKAVWIVKNKENYRKEKR